jgi:hypothetical protein
VQNINNAIVETASNGAAIDFTETRVSTRQALPKVAPITPAACLDVLGEPHMIHQHSTSHTMIWLRTWCWPVPGGRGEVREGLQDETDRQAKSRQLVIPLCGAP